MRWPLQPLQPFQQTQLQPPFGQSVDSLCHPWFTTNNLSYRFPIFETSATALCGTTGTHRSFYTQKLFTHRHFYPQKILPPSKGSRNSCQARFPGTGSQARFPRTGFQEKVAKKVSKNRFASKGFPGKVPGNRFPSKVRKTRFPSKVRKNRFTSKGFKNSASSSQARIPRTGFLAG